MLQSKSSFRIYDEIFGSYVDSFGSAIEVREFLRTNAGCYLVFNANGEDITDTF